MFSFQSASKSAQSSTSSHVLLPPVLRLNSSCTPRNFPNYAPTVVSPIFASLGLTPSYFNSDSGDSSSQTSIPRQIVSPTSTLSSPTMSPTPPALTHPMVTRAQNNIHQHKQFHDGTIRYALPKLTLLL